jgi:phosphatidylserine decarboxylase
MDKEGILMQIIQNLMIGTGMALALLLPPAIKWELPRKTVVVWAVFVGLLTGLLQGLFLPDTSHIVWRIFVQGSLIMGFTIPVLAWRFFRDPERTPPQDPHAMISPADGEVIYVNRFEAGQVPVSQKGKGCFSLRDFTDTDLFGDGGYVIGIAMNFLNVHVNRAPIDGEIEMLKRIPGLFLSLKKPEALVQNERVLTVIRRGDFRAGVVQIASRLVRKIVSYQAQGSVVTKGQRIGVIKFGSQVDLILPASVGLEILCKVGDNVYAGRSILARLAAQKI